MAVEVKLSTGETVRVYAVSSLVVLRAMAQVKTPVMPTVTLHVGAEDAGHDETHPAPVESDAFQRYTEALNAARQEQNKIANEILLLAGLRDTPLPQADDWWDATSMAYAGIQRREGEAGRRLDYFEYVLLAARADLKLVYDTINQLGEGSAAKAQNLEASFRGTGDDSGAAADAGRAADGAGREAN